MINKLNFFRYLFNNNFLQKNYINIILTLILIIIVFAFLLIYKYLEKKKKKEKFNIKNEEKDLCFIIIRHVTSKETNEYWKKSYSYIRKYYPKKKNYNY